MQLTSRTAVHADISALVPLMRAAIDQLQKEFLDEAQVAAMASLAGRDALPRGRPSSRSRR
jgi:hypothetical protein